MSLTVFSKFVAEFSGTLILVLLSCCSVIRTGISDVVTIGILGLTFVAFAYVVGQVSGCHINPSISISMVVIGKMKVNDAAIYVAAQILGAIAGAAILLFIASRKEAYQLTINGLSSNGNNNISLSGYSLLAGFIAETVFMVIFTLVILGFIAAKKIHSGFAGVFIGLSLIVIDMIGIPLTGISINPARSIGLALLIGGDAIEQLWLFIMPPILGSVSGAIIWRYLFVRN